MAAKIGILGESTVTTVATTTIYTVPADKAARIRILFCAENGGSTTGYAVRVGTPGTEANLIHTVNADTDFFTGLLVGATNRADDIGIQEADLGDVLAASGTDRAAVLPLPVDFFLSTGDTVDIRNANNALSDHLFQVIGVEDDA